MLLHTPRPLLLALFLQVVIALSHQQSSVMAATTSNTQGIDDADTEWGRALEKQQPLPLSCQHSPNDVTETVDIAVVGGGLVGLAIAVGLMNRGVVSSSRTCRVYERAPRLRSESQGILALQPNGIRALESIDPRILPQVLERGCERHYFRKTVIDRDGTVTEDNTVNSGDQILEKYGVRKIGMTWHNMQQVLYNLLSSSNSDSDAAGAVSPTVEVRTGHSLQSYHEEGDDSILLYFENGNVVRARAVLACDGLFSAARRQIVATPQGDEEDDDDEGRDSPIFFGQLNWATIIPTSQLPLNIHGKNTVRYVTYGGNPRWMSMMNDGGSNYTFFQFRMADPAKAMELSGNAGRGGLGLKGTKLRLLGAIEGQSRDVYDVIRSIPERQIFERSIVGRYPLTTWRSPQNGRLVLVGDSAHGMHPNIAQGANQAFVSAASIVDVLAEELLGSDNDGGEGDVRAAFRKFERVRKPNADLVQRFANAMGVVQATGQEVLSSEDVGKTLDWILKGDDGSLDDVSEKVVATLESFDPCDYDGVSKLW